MSTASDIITEVGYELVNESGDFGNSELLAYINHALELLHCELVDRGSELARTGTGSFTTTAGTQSYDLTSESMSDIWRIHRVWVSGSLPMDACEESDLYESINAEEDSETGHRTEPQHWCLIGDTLWFQEVPDDAYTINVRYFPKFSALTINDDMPYHDLLNLPVKSMVMLLARNRNLGIDRLHSQLVNIVQSAVSRLVNSREMKRIRLKVSPWVMRNSLRRYR